MRDFRRQNGKPWGTRPAKAQGLGSSAQAVAAGVIAALAALPTWGLGAEMPMAVLQLSEVMADPGGNLTEAEGEWTEVLAIEGGDAAGWVLTDFDGGIDFVFPSIHVSAGERLVVANGKTVPSGVSPSAAVLFAAKSWYTFDNRGDEVALQRPNGTVESALRWGDGVAVDLAEVATPLTLLDEEPLPEGASLGVSEGRVQLMRPTPGAANRPLWRAADAGVRLAGVAGAPGSFSVWLCTSGPDPFDPFLWRFAWGTRVAELSAGAAGNCIRAGAPLGPAWESAAAEALGVSLAASVPFDTKTWNETAPVKLLDPWGAQSLSFVPPPAPATGPRTVTVWTPCLCEGGWRRVPFDPVPAALPPRPIFDVQVLPAGPGLQLAVVGLLQAAAHTVDLNTYLLTSAAVMHELSNASARGVAVRLLLEPSPVGGVSSDSALSASHTLEWNASGVRARTFNATEPNGARDHAKYIVADGRRVLVSTENFVGAAFSPEDPNTGYALILNSTELAADLTGLFEWDFDLARSITEDSPRGTSPVPLHVMTEVSTSTASLLVSPREGIDEWVALVENATESVMLEALSLDFETAGPGAPLGHALLAACARGVSVRALVAGPLSAGATENLLVARALVAAAGAAGCAPHLEVRVDPRAPGGRSVLHAKVIVADSAEAILGSHNLVDAAFDLNREVSVKLLDAGAASALHDALASDFESGAQVEAAALWLDGPGVLGAASGGTLAGAPPPTYASLAILGTAATLWALLGGRRWSIVRRRPRQPGRRAAPGRATPPVDLLAVQARAPSSAVPRPPPESFNPRALPPVEPLPAARGAREALPPSALELFEKR